MNPATTSANSRMLQSTVVSARRGSPAGALVRSSRTEHCRERDAGGAAEGREHRALGDEQPRETARAGAECDAHRKLAPARFAAHEQKTGDVRARDEQDEQHRAEDDEQHRAHAARDLLFDRNDERVEADVRHVAELLELGDE